MTTKAKSEPKHHISQVKSHHHNHHPTANPSSLSFSLFVLFSQSLVLGVDLFWNLLFHGFMKRIHGFTSVAVCLCPISFSLSHEFRVMKKRSNPKSKERNQVLKPIISSHHHQQRFRIALVWFPSSHKNTQRKACGVVQPGIIMAKEEEDIAFFSQVSTPFWCLAK